MSIGTQVSVSELVRAPSPAPAAFRLFTARGETLWVPGWSPEFFAAVADDIAIGTVFRTRDDTRSRTTWVVVDCDPGRRMRYARVVEAGSTPAS